MIKYTHFKSLALSITENKLVILIIPLIIIIGAKSSLQIPVTIPNDKSVHNLELENEMFVDAEDVDFDMDSDGFHLSRRQNTDKDKEDYGLSEESCMVYNITDDVAKSDCSPGSMYIIRCTQCICPYIGSITSFCRPLPPGTYCEQAYPGYNYLPMGRRQKLEEKDANHTLLHHHHTKYNCNETGRIADECFLCDCVDGVLIEEHCFQKDSQECETALPTFLKYGNKKIMLL